MWVATLLIAALSVSALQFRLRTRSDIARCGLASAPVAFDTAGNPHARLAFDYPNAAYSLHSVQGFMVRYDGGVWRLITVTSFTDVLTLPDHTSWRFEPARDKGEIEICAVH